MSNADSIQAAPMILIAGALVAVAGKPKMAFVLWPYGIRFGTCSLDKGSPAGRAGVLSTAIRLVYLLTR